MSATISIEDAQTKLKEVISKPAAGEELVITENEKPVAKLIGERSLYPPRPAPGLGKGSIVYVAADFDEPLEEFKLYTE